MPQLEIQQWERYEGENSWTWAVWIEGPEAALDQIAFVEWTLHPTLPNPIRKVRDRETKFRLEITGLGAFPVIARVQLKDGKQSKLHHYLKLHYPDGRDSKA